MVCAFLGKGNDRGGAFRLAGLVQRVEARVRIVSLVVPLPGYTMIDQSVSGLYISTDVHLHRKLGFLSCFYLASCAALCWPEGRNSCKTCVSG